MTTPIPIRRALVSVSDKSHLDRLARMLVEHRIEVLSTGGTYRALSELGVSVRKVSEYTGAPEILDGRVKTLHPRIHGGILAAPTPEHDAERERHDIPAIDLVVVNLYPFREVIREPGCDLPRAVENIDIGGPTMVRAAAKNAARVTVVVDPADYEGVAAALRQHAGTVPLPLRRTLARKAFAHTAAYDAAIAAHLAQHEAQHEAPHEASAEREDDAAPVFFVGGERQGVLRYGENPHQAAGLYAVAGEAHEASGLPQARVLQGKALSYNNLLDADAALALIRDLEPLGTAAAVLKHASPCGAAVGQPGQGLCDVFVRAREADAESAFGGIVALSHEVDADTARRLCETFLEVVVAPGYSTSAREILAAKKNLRLLELPDMFAEGPPPWRVRSVAGGLLVQREDVIRVGAAKARVATRRAPTRTELADLEVAWRVAKHVRSNAIVIAKDGVTLGIGGGQTSRVEASRQASRHAGEAAAGAVLASDGFFPFRDGVDAAAAVGVTAVIQPGGSMRDREVVDAADEHGLAMLLAGERHFRH
ncbi:bifunctional phosphoribosylaminoimidazolecarboxamide formyltransferase/IMP cyclohydrolase [Paraliomyxa miuraensis]|uniref:bifunctional phosphoribosylaminoimidazolecarboxamide formyltransferase/IMP cyclohydrolase n=1 Tax=Paraliomyxa miuraensis TaxID=376150 RepID=UPI0022537237|nr:bifunctional phosphoribosylaminoimidazolecarboxamide formyltransferase/IMP cyclohydrolase [Paraliomyxa miuraensis]MCX4242351.1 bifunctional phosphoribosylaminoimidazolecarboxamide formyltransferase/IMP cyclohydrolase [Paraliomyxa miuraensis]